MAIIAFLTLLLAPAYAVRFEIAGFPANLLLVWIALVWLYFLPRLFRKTTREELRGFLKALDLRLLASGGVFFLSGSIALFVGGFSAEKLAQYVVLFVQPASLFLIFGFAFKNSPKARNGIKNSAYLLLAAMGLWSLVQYFSGMTLPPEYWGNPVEPRRAVGFFSHPNFYALFSAPLLAFLLPDLFAKYAAPRHLWPAAAWLLGAAGLGLSLSRAGWIGLIAAILVFVLLKKEKKSREAILTVLAGLLVVALVTPGLRQRLLQPFYGEKSSSSRLSLWQTGWKSVQENPVFGLGLKGFAKEWPRLNQDPEITQTHNFPHNLFLNAWAETGLLGLAGFIGLILSGVYLGYKKRAEPIAFGVMLFFLALLAQGQIDNPYFKNDLALVFWIILSLIA